MAFPTGWQRRCALVIQQSLIPADQTAFPVLVSHGGAIQDCLPAEMLTSGGSNAAQSDGGDIRFSSDAAGASQLACEVVRWVQNANPTLAEAEIWVPVNILGASDVTIYVWYKAGGSETQPAANAPFGSQAVWDSNFKAVFHLPNGSSLTAGDSTSNANNGTVNGSMAATPGQIDGAALGANDAAKYISTSYVPPTTNFTYSCWIKSSARDLFNRPMGSADASAGLSGASVIWGWKPGDVTGSDSIFVIFRQGSNVTTGDISYTPAGLTNNFTHLAIRMHSTNGGSLCINGVQVATNGAYTSITLGGLTFTIGKDPNQSTESLDGRVDEVRVSNVVRTEDWLATEYANQIVPDDFVIAGSPVDPNATVVSRRTLGELGTRTGSRQGRS